MKLRSNFTIYELHPHARINWDVNNKSILYGTEKHCKAFPHPAPCQYFWKYITYTLFVMFCAYYIFFKACCDPLQSCPLRKMHPEKRPLYHAYQVAYISNAILAMASILSCLAFIGCCMVGKRQKSALMCPSEFMIKEIAQVNLFRLFLAFLIMIVLLTTSMIFTSLTEKTSVINWTNISKATVSRKAGLHSVRGRFGRGMVTAHVSHNFKNSTCKIWLSPGPNAPRLCEAIASEDSTQFFLHFISLNICHIFAAVCMVLGKLTYSIFLKNSRLFIPNS